MTGLKTADEDREAHPTVPGPRPADHAEGERGAGFIYLDASALAKLVIHEAESLALRDHIAASGRPGASSAIARVEVRRAAMIANPTTAGRDEAEDRLAEQFLVAVTDAVLSDAADLASLRLRSLDAIHLASARAIPTHEFITYDERLAEAARGQGMTVVQPGRPASRRHRVHDRDG